MLKFSIKFEPNPLTNNIHELPDKVDRMVAAVMERQAAASEAYMKSNAPWHDRTGNARGGLHTEVQHGNKEHSVILAHGVPYGIWLEVRWGGRLAIIGPALQAGAQEVMALIGGGMARL